jgi:tetratricopeptide (TPR) repeat protein
MKKSVRKIWPVLVSAGSTLTMLVVFFIPSIQDQWDRYQSRQIVQQYVRLGDDFYDDGRYEPAEQAYAKAFELSEEQRLDIEIKRLGARVHRMGLEADWGAAPPEDIEDVDFQFLLQFQKEKEFDKQRVSTLNSYGIFLAAKEQPERSAEIFREALALDSTNVLVLINYGNLLDQTGKKQQAEVYYKKALARDPENIQAHYNLGLIYREAGLDSLARRQFQHIVQLDSTYKEAAGQLHELNAKDHGSTRH